MSFRVLIRTRPNSIFSTPGVMKIVGTGRNPQPVRKAKYRLSVGPWTPTSSFANAISSLWGSVRQWSGGTWQGLEGTMVQSEAADRVWFFPFLFCNVRWLSKLMKVWCELSSDPAILHYSVDADCGAATRAIRRGRIMNSKIQINAREIALIYLISIALTLISRVWRFLVHAQETAAAKEPDFATREPRYHIGLGDIIDVEFPLVPEFNQTVTVQPDGFIR